MIGNLPFIIPFFTSNIYPFLVAAPFIPITFFASLFATKQNVMMLAAGILPMAYGDADASMVGERHGKRKYGVFAEKSLEGSAAMFLVSFLIFTFSLFFFSLLLPFSFLDKVYMAVTVAAFFYMVDVIRSIILYSWRKFDYIIFVRYLMGTAYLPSPSHRIAYHFFASVVPTSNFMFFLDITPEEAYKRMQQGRKTREMFESLGELERIRRKALFLASIGKWTIINANRPVKEIEKEIIKHCN